MFRDDRKIEFAVIRIIDFNHSIVTIKDSSMRVARILRWYYIYHSLYRLVHCYYYSNCTITRHQPFF